MRKAKPSRWTETYAREVIERAKQSNLSDAALARELGVGPHRIYWWRNRLRATQALARRSQSPAQQAFVEVKLAAPASRPFAIRTRGGRIIDVWPGFDADELARLLAVVENEPC